MLLRYFTIIALALVGIKLTEAQKIDYTPPVTREVLLDYKDSVEIFNVSTVSDEVEVDDELMYFWYYEDKIHKNRGGYQGVLLSGNYSLLDKNESLVVNGKYLDGVKDGVWKYWHENGEIKETQEWKKGLRIGSTIVYNEDGKKIKEYNFKGGVLSGYCYEYYNDTAVRKEYKEGVEVTTEKKKPKRRDRNKRISLIFERKEPAHPKNKEDVLKDTVLEQHLKEAKKARENTDRVENQQSQEPLEKKEKRNREATQIDADSFSKRKEK